MGINHDYLSKSGLHDGDLGKEVRPIEIYPTVEGLKVKPTIILAGTGRGVWIKTRNDTINLGDFDRSEIIIDTENFYLTKMVHR